MSATTVATDLGLDARVVERHLNLLVEASQLSCGDYRPDGTSLEYCAPLILARLHRESLRRAREQVAPVPPEQYARFLPTWQGIGQHVSPRKAIEALLYLPMTRDRWRAALTARAAEDTLDALTSRGTFEWRGAGGGRLELVEPGAPGVSSRTVEGYGTDQVLALLRNRGALFASDIARRLARTDQPLGLAEVENALELLEDAGLVANDLLSRAGRWSTTETGGGTVEQQLECYLEALLRRYGVVSREIFRADKSAFKWQQAEQTLRLWEWRGRVLRGHFVRDLSAPQFARREAVDLLREAPCAEALLLPWDDPANAWGRILAHPAPRGKGRFVLVSAGEPLLTVAGWGRDLAPGPAWSPDKAAMTVQTLIGLAQYAPNGMLALERWQTGSVLVSPVSAALREAGFVRAGLRYVYRRPRTAAAFETAVS